LGDFYRYLSESNVDCIYTGYDIIPEYVVECAKRYPQAAFHLRNIFQDGIDDTYDTVIMSQVFNNRYHHSDNLEVLRAALAMAFEHARVSVSVDMMSTYVDFQNPDLYYYAPEDIFTIARTIARRVVLRHDYRPYEFCVQLFHDSADGFAP
jgi:hypothetical protein